MTRSPLRYRFGPLERRGLLGPVRAGQALMVAGGVVGAVAVVDHAPTLTGLLLATLLLAGALGVALAPAGGRTLEEWTPIVWRFVTSRLSGRARYRSRVPCSGFAIGVEHGGDRADAAGPGSSVAPRRDAGRSGIRAPMPAPPRALRDVRIDQADYQGRTLGVVSERRGRLLTAVLACRVIAFTLLDPDAQERRLSRWGLILSGAASRPIRRLAWVERTAPAQADELVRWLHAERDPAVPLRGTPMIDSYLELIGATSRVTQEHEILLAVQIDRHRVRERGAAAGVDALIAETERVARGLEAAEVTVLGALSPGQLARTLRTGFDPYARAELAALETADRSRDGLDEATAWPLAAEERWDLYRADGAVHATYWIGGWPRVEVSPLFLEALLGRSSAVRTVAVTFEPISPVRSTREVEAAITRDRADHELRHRYGQSETARQRQARDATLRREAELAAGHGEVRLAGFVTVSGRDPDELRQAVAEVVEHAARARLELHRLYGQQAEAFAFTLPLCRGLR